MTDVRSAFPATALIILNPPVRLGPLAGRENPTCGTVRKFYELASRTNIHGISGLRRASAFGTVVAKDLACLNPHHGITASKFQSQYYYDD
jgi:hypothetical protein